MEYKKNDIVTVTIEDMGQDGEGIGKADGYTLFVKDAVIGDVAEVLIMKVKKNYAYARLRKVVTPSSFRVEPRCAFHRQCGGCQLQAMSYDKQLEWKERKIRNHLIRIGGFAAELVDAVMEPVVGMSEKEGKGAFRYRNKAQYPVGKDQEGNFITGFYAGRTHHIIANTDCYLGAEGNREILEVILAHMKEYKISAYDENTGMGLVRHILIRTGFASKEVMVCLVINSKSVSGEELLRREKGLPEEMLPGQRELMGKLRGIPGMTSISVSINRERTNVIMGKEVYLIWGKETISDTISMRDAADDFALTGEGITFQISPLSFYQVNPVQTEKLYSIALEYAGLTGRETVWDLYCGIGTISLFLAGKAGWVYGVEVVEAAVRDARKNAENNGIKNVSFFVGKVEEVLPEKYEQEGISADVIVVDPPRKGCDEACLETMLKIQAGKIVYISCDSATLARDLRVLCDGGYEIERVRGVDLFGQTVHVESVCLMTRRER